MRGTRTRSAGTPAQPPEDRTAVVIGASMAGLLAAAALARGGFQVTVVERDQLPERAESRRGVPQDRQAHIVLHRGLTAIEGLLPGFRTELLARDAVPFDTGAMPWLGEYGWLDSRLPGWEVISATRPLMDATARHLLKQLPGVTVCPETKVSGLRSHPTGWAVSTDRLGPQGAADGALSCRLVVDASGRGSRLPRWLPGLGESRAEEVDARIGYASRLYRQRRPLPLRTGVMIYGRAEDGAAGLALPVEGDQWMIAASGLADHRPPRETAGFESFLAGLRDRAIGDLLQALDPVGDVAVHRQTANRRHGWGRRVDWPSGLLVLGDALCSLNPIYGQGITVAALQAEELSRWVTSGRRVDRSLQRRLHALTELPWSIATGNDLRFPTAEARQSLPQRLGADFTMRVSRLAATGNARATRTLSDVYHLMSPASALVHPSLLLAVARPLPTTRPPRPAVLDGLSRARQDRPPVGPAGA